MNEQSPHIKRAYFGKTCTEKNLSVNTRLILSEVIKKSRLAGGDKEAELMAEELTKMVNSCKTEEEVLQKLKQMKK